MAKFCKVGEAAEIMGKTRNTVYNRLKDGRLQTVVAFKGTPAAEEFFYKSQVIALRDEAQSAKENK